MFYRRGLIERWGRGTNRVIESTVAAGKPEPDYAQMAGCTVVSFRLSKPLTTQVTTQVTGEVTGEVRRLLATLHQPMKRTKIQASLGLKHKDHIRAAYLLPALEAGLIERTIPDKPNSRLQKYRLTENGRALLEKEGGRS